MNKFITLREPHYTDGGISDEEIFLNINMISEILPHDAAACRGDSDAWKTMIICNNGNKYRVVEDPKRVFDLIAAAE